MSRARKFTGSPTFMDSHIVPEQCLNQRNLGHTICVGLCVDGSHIQCICTRKRYTKGTKRRHTRHTKGTKGTKGSICDGVEDTIFILLFMNTTLLNREAEAREAKSATYLIKGGYLWFLWY